MTRARDVANIDGVLTTTGDMYVASAAATPARLGIGSTGQVLTVAGGTASWATPAGGSDNYTLINTGGTSLSGSTTTISGISGKNSLFIRVSGASTTTNANSLMYLRLNSDTGSNYYRIAVESSGSNTFNGIGSESSSLVRLARQGNFNATLTTDALILINGCNGTGLKNGNYVGTGNAQTASDSFAGMFTYSGTSTISSISITTGDTFDAGTVFVYGA